MTVYIIYYTYKMCNKILWMCFISISYLFIFSSPCWSSLPSRAWARSSLKSCPQFANFISKIPFLGYTIWWTEQDFPLADLSEGPHPSSLTLALCHPSLSAIQSLLKRPQALVSARVHILCWRTPIGDQFPDLSFSLHNWSGGFEMYSAFFSEVVADQFLLLLSKPLICQ